MTTFKYNFEPGSESSVKFLELYAEHESEDIIRSKLRLIIEKKF
jgi:hypothetical protein